MIQEEAEAFRQKFKAYSDQELIRIAYLETDSYLFIVAQMARDELNSRGVSDPRIVEDEVEQSYQDEFFGVAPKNQNFSNINLTETLTRKPSNYVLDNLAIVVGFLALVFSLVPPFGFILCLISFGWGALLIRRKRGKLMMLIGFVGICLSIVFWSLLPVVIQRFTSR